MEGARERAEARTAAPPTTWKRGTPEGFRRSCGSECRDSVGAATAAVKQARAADTERTANDHEGRNDAGRDDGRDCRVL